MNGFSEVTINGSGGGGRGRGSGTSAGDEGLATARRCAAEASSLGKAGRFKDSLMKAVESEGGQDADEFADFASRQTFPDGTNMLALLHNDNYIKKFKTKDIMVTYGSGEDGRILLNKLNEMIAKEKGVSVKDLAKDPEATDQSTC